MSERVCAFSIVLLLATIVHPLMPPKSSRAPKRSHRPHDTDSDVDDEAQAHPSDEVGHRQKLHLLAGQLFGAFRFSWSTVLI